MLLSHVVQSSCPSICLKEVWLMQGTVGKGWPHWAYRVNWMLLKAAVSCMLLTAQAVQSYSFYRSFVSVSTLACHGGYACSLCALNFWTSWCAHTHARLCTNTHTHTHRHTHTVCDIHIQILMNTQAVKQLQQCRVSEQKLEGEVALLEQQQEQQFEVCNCGGAFYR